MNNSTASRIEEYYREWKLRVHSFHSFEDGSIFKSFRSKSSEKGIHKVDKTREILVLCPRSNHFKDKIVEKEYQENCIRFSYARARMIICTVMALHVTLSILFHLLEDNQGTGFDLLPRRYDIAGEWMQWTYIFIALPLVVFPKGRNQMISYWKRWVSLLLVLLIAGIQIWLTYQARDSENKFTSVLQTRTWCNESVENLSMELRAESRNYRTGMNVFDFLILRNSNLNSAFVALASTLLTVVGSTLAVALRLDFLHVVSVCVLSAVSLMLVMAIYGIEQLWPLVFAYVFPGCLLCMSSYYSDKHSRLSYVQMHKAQKENVILEKELHKAEEALRNDAARESEIKAVANGLLKLESPGNTCELVNADLMQSVRIPFDDIKLLKRIGRGGMGEVILAEYLGTEVVCKRMLRENISISSMKSFRTEIELLACLRHPNIVQMIGACWDNASNVCMVMEYMPKGDVHSVLHSSLATRFTWSDPLLKMTVDICQGMLYLHSQDPPVVHRDLKSANLLCSATYGCKLTDFGLSRRQQDVDALTTVVGTPFWLAPEVIRNEKYGTKADVYSFGIVLTELESRKTPYNELSETGIKVMMKVAKEGLRPEIPSTCLPARRKLIDDCLLDNPRKRLSFSQILTRLQGALRQELVGEDESPGAERRATFKRQQFFKSHDIDIIIEEDY